MIKRVFSLALALLMLGAMLAGCGGDTQPVGQTEPTEQTGTSGANAEGVNEEIYNKLAAEYQFDLSQVQEKQQSGQALQVLVLLGMSLAYYFALSALEMPYLAVTLGSMTLALSVFEVATVVFLAAMMLYLGVRNKAVLVFVPIGASAFLSIMFRTLLRVLLP